MEEKEDEKLKDEVVLFSDIVEWLGDDNERILKVRVNCLNCGHKDIVGMLITKCGYTMGNGIHFNNDKYNVFFRCPKCGSGAIALDESEIPKIVAEKLSQ